MGIFGFGKKSSEKTTPENDNTLIKQEETSTSNSEVLSNQEEPKEPVVVDEYAETKSLMSEDQENAFNERDDKKSISKTVSKMKDDDKKNYFFLELTDHKAMLNPLTEKILIASKNEAAKKSVDIGRDILGVSDRSFSSIRPDTLGYKIRVFIIERSRTWAQKIVEDEYTAKKAEIETENVDVSEKLKDLELKKMQLKASLYESVKADFMTKIAKETLAIADESFDKFGADLKTTANDEVISTFKSTYKSIFNSKAMKKKPIDERMSFAKETSVETLDKKVNDIASSVISKNSKLINKYSLDSATSKRDSILSAVTGGATKIPDIKKMDQTDLSAAQYLYSDTDEGTDISDKENSLKESVMTDAIVAPNMNKSLILLETGLMKAVPKEGDSVKVKSQIDIPVFSGVTIGIGVSGEAEREEDRYVKAKLSMNLHASGSIGIGKVSGEIGGLVETHAKKAEDASLLISYVLYRRARESSTMPSNLTDAIWGLGGKTGEGSFNEAEAFGASAEKYLFKENEENSVKYGKFVGLSAEIGDEDVLGGKVSAKAIQGSSYNKETLEKEDRLGKMEAYKRFGQKSKGENFKTIVFEAGISGGGFSGSGKITIPFDSENNYKAVQLELTGGCSMPIGTLTDLAIDKLLEAIDIMLDNGTIFVVKGGKIANKNDSQVENDNVDSDYEINVKQIKSNAKSSASVAMKEINESNDVLSGEKGYELTLSYDKPKGKKGELSIGLNATAGLNVNLGLVKLGIERSTNIFTLNFANEEVDATPSV
ncbi:hypothetical protein [Helicovermis profundi]|uniref:hypothetical protein n=1 Tax=Helicovermis profundi TaxID=3065157 RepID=UPI0030D5180C